MPTDWSTWGNNLAGGGGAGQYNFSDWFNPGDDFGRSKTKGNRWGSAASGAMSGASTGAAFGPWGAAIGGIGGGILGFATGGPKEMSPAEQRVNNWDIMMNEAGKNIAPQMLGDWANSIGSYTQGIGALAQQGPPDQSRAQAQLGQVEGNINKLSNFKPERIDRNAEEWRRLMQQGMGSVINPSMLAANQQQQEATKAIAANPNLTAQQRAQMKAEGQRNLAQTNAGVQGQAIQAGMSALKDLAVAGDTLVERALEAAGQLGIQAAKLEMDLANLPYQWQLQLLDLLSKAPNMFAQYMSFIRPGDPQYQAAGQGGRTGTDWMGIAQKGVDIYKGAKGGGGGGTSANEAAWNAASP
jgi:hypothetical protein